MMIVRRVVSPDRIISERTFWAAVDPYSAEPPRLYNDRHRAIATLGQIKGLKRRLRIQVVAVRVYVTYQYKQGVLQ